jgi:galactose mutarotase-like enzyme
MAAKSWKLIDVEARAYIENLAITPDEVGGPAEGYSVTKQRLRGGLSDGVDLVRVDNGTLAFSVLPTRGMGIWKAFLGETEIGWRSPVRGPVHPSLVPLMEPGGLGWLDGFDELLCRCGLESNGAPDFGENGQLIYPLHGRIANRPAHKVEVSVDGDAGEIAVSGEVDEARLFFNKLRLFSEVRTKVGQPGLTVLDTVTNISAQECELELLYHVNFGNPLLTPGAQVVLPVSKMAPRDPVAVENLPQWDQYGPETPGSAEAVFFFELAADADGRTQALLKNAAGDMGVTLKLDRNQLPYFIVWKNRQAAADGYVTGLEPAINFPNPKSFEKAKGRVAVLAPGESRTFEIAMDIHTGGASVAAAEAEVQTLQEGTEPMVLQQPDPEWSAG